MTCLNQILGLKAELLNAGRGVPFTPSSFLPILKTKTLHLPLKDVCQISGIDSVTVGCEWIRALKPDIVVTIDRYTVSSKVKFVEIHCKAWTNAVTGNDVGFGQGQ